MSLDNLVRRKIIETKNKLEELTLKKKLPIITMVAFMMVTMLVGCSDNAYNTADGKGLFAKIEVDYSRTLTTNTSCYHYYYLKDTGIVYVGWIGSSGLNSTDTVSPAISPNGNYYLYDAEKQEVVEIIKDTK